ncbi:MAG: glycosyltransferase family 4 protein [bacterium]
MKICFIGDFLRNRHNTTWVHYFYNAGYNVELIGEHNPQIKGIPFHSLKVPPIPFLKTFFRIWKIKKILLQSKPDILHAFDSIYGYLGALSFFHPLVITLWNDEIALFKIRNFLEKKFIIYGLKKADLITADAKCVVSSVENLLNKKNFIEFILTGIDLNLFNPRCISDLKKQLNIPEDFLVVTSLRSFEKEYYNLDIIVKSIPYIIANFPKTIFLFLHNGKFFESIQKQVKKLNIEKFVKFVGLVPHNKMAHYLNISDIAITIPSTDATSSSLLESMACKIPIIASDLPANCDWIKNDWNGLIVPSRDVKKLETAILILLKNFNQRKIFAERSFEIVKQFDYKLHMKKMKELYQNLVKTFS